jgi:hypothetical protein
MVRTMCALTCVLFIAATAEAQMTYRLRGTVRDNAGKPVSEASVRAEALIGFRGEQFVGQKEFETKTNDKGEWVILGLTSGIWAFDATGPSLVPQVVVLPIHFTRRQPQSAQGGSFPWDLPLRVRPTEHAGLMTAAGAAMARQTDAAIGAIGALGSETDPDVLCAAGELALLVRQNGLGFALFDRALKLRPKDACATLGLASTALMQNDHDRASKMLWEASSLAPREQRPALGAAIKDLQQITGTK